MKWGVRRYQNEDGTLTPAGKRRYQQYSDAMSKGYANLSNQLPGIAAVAKYRADTGRATDPNADTEKIRKDTITDFTLGWLESDSNFKKARKIAEKYNMSAWNEDVRDEETSYKEAMSTRSLDPYLKKFGNYKV